MAVGFVRVHALAQPKDLIHVQVLAQVFLDLLLGEFRVAARAQQALLGDHQGALAVHMDGAALQHKVIGLVHIHIFDVADLGRDPVVLVPGEIQAVEQAAPSIEVPIDGAHLALVVLHEGGAAIPHPAVVAGNFDHAHVLAQKAAGVFELGVAHAHGDGLELCDGIGHVGEHLLGGLCAVAPVVGPLGPEHPGLLVLLKFAGHAEAVLAGGGVGDGTHDEYSPF